VDRSHFAQELSCHQTNPENLAFVVESRRFQVEREEGMEEVVGQEGQQQETFDGIGGMAKHVIGMPFMREPMERNPEFSSSFDDLLHEMQDLRVFDTLRYLVQQHRVSNCVE
jgi:hypothetical protein